MVITRKRHAKFRSRIKKENGCWLWQGAKTHSGYGVFQFRGKQEGAHRVSWMIYRGPLRGKWVLHKCDTPECVRPAHLFLGTQFDNGRDRAIKYALTCNHRSRLIELGVIKSEE